MIPKGSGAGGLTAEFLAVWASRYCSRPPLLLVSGLLPLDAPSCGPLARLFILSAKASVIGGPAGHCGMCAHGLGESGWVWVIATRCGSVRGVLSHEWM